MSFRTIPDDLLLAALENLLTNSKKRLNKEALTAQSSTDSGFPSDDAASVFSDFEEEDQVVVKADEASCAGDKCFCKEVKTWLKNQASHDRNIEKDDAFYAANKSSLWPLPERDGTQYRWDPYPSIANESFRQSGGSRDKLGRPHETACLYFPTGRRFSGSFRHGLRQGYGVLCDREGTRIISGNYHSDKLEGVCEAATNEGGRMELVFRRGIVHGPARRFGPGGELQWVGRYRNGVPYSICWRSNDGDGWLVGPCNRSGRMHGDNVVYIYPDIHTALVGVWCNDHMRKGRLATVTGISEKDGMPWPEITLNEEEEEITYSLDLSTYDTISNSPMLRDPFEKKMVECRDSALPNGGEGLFALHTLKKDSVVAFYNGVRFHDCHAFNDWDHNSYKIRLNEKKKQILDIPPACRSKHHYNATLAHKINHSFMPNARFCDFAHPRFGRILCVKTMAEVGPGEELFCNYGYSLSDCPQWYKEAYRASIRS